MGLSKNIIVYVKDERVNLNSMTTTLKSIVNYEVLGLEMSWAQKTTRIGTKPRTRQGEKITKNASLNLIQD